MRKGGRPRREIDFDQFEKLCEIHCTLKEICQYFRISEPVINKRITEEYGKKFSEVIEDFKGEGKANLRRLQFEAANKGNITMLIFLGKNYLGQADKIENKVDSSPVNISFVRSES